MLKYLNGLPHVKAIKVHGSAYGRAGNPDIIGSYRGRSFAIEAKRPGEADATTPLQDKELAAWSDSYAITGVATSIDEVKALLDQAEDHLVEQYGWPLTDRERRNLELSRR